jgi:transcriptional regulator with XRE-family HTH domain
MSTKKQRKSVVIPTFAKTITILRKKVGLKQKDLARKVGYEPNYFSQVMRGKIPATERLINSVAHELNVSPENLRLGMTNETGAKYLTPKEVLKSKAHEAARNFIESAEIGGLRLLLEYIAVLQKSSIQTESPPRRGDEDPFQTVGPDNDSKEFRELARREP